MHGCPPTKRSCLIDRRGSATSAPKHHGREGRAIRMRQ
eukprot:CAMPEP_0119385380 /NCGR_PEP_ID=MMETSP1334-20130426/90918_1 /TAXON_ID=127549 /ORGANISM="Calcidiscus leptoporus, Strain RCC1130" /LENGTH=37 /DNA_ID= /DNA_START= /DNA_END= /DNA_ORIENTATION=